MYASDESGAWQLYAWDRAAGVRRRVTDVSIGVRGGAVTPDGEGVVWFDDQTGDEHGHWVVEAFDARAEMDSGERRPLMQGVPDAWPSGLALGDELMVVGTGSPDGFRIHVASKGEPAREIHHHPQSVFVGGLARDGSLLAFMHAEHGDNMHHALRVVDPATGRVAGEQWDGKGFGLRAAAWSPMAGDQRLALVHERSGKDRPAVWDLGSGERTDIEVELPGELDVLDWWPDASGLLVVHVHEGRSELYRLDPDDPSNLVRVPHAAGSISGAGVRPDGEVWYRVDSGAEPPSIRRDHDAAVVLAPDGEPAPDGRPFRSWWFSNPKGDRVHGFVVAPPGEGPFPLVMLVHGGPTWSFDDTFMPGVQAWVDHGFAVALANYRGSTGYGREFRDVLQGNPGFPEVEDIHAGLDDLIAGGVADPARCVVSGASWGGYITLLSLGLHPDRWVAGVAAVPVADYPTAYADEAPFLQAYDRALFGGSPEEVPEMYVERSPLTYIEHVRAPLLILAGDNDSRCPIRQILNYVARLEELGREFELYRFEAGHGSMVVDEQVRQMKAELAFVTARVSAGRPAEAR